VTLSSLNIPLLGTPLYDELMTSRGAPLPEFELWDPTPAPKLDLGRESDELLQAAESLSKAIFLFPAQAQEVSDAIAAFHRDALHNVEETVRGFRLRYQIPLRPKLSDPPTAEPAPELPSRAAMRNSCSTCFPRPCDLENPRSECRRTAPPVSEQQAVEFKPSGELREWLYALHNHKPIPGHESPGEVTITSVPAEVIEQAVQPDNRLLIGATADGDAEVIHWPEESEPRMFATGAFQALQALEAKPDFITDATDFNASLARPTMARNFEVTGELPAIAMTCTGDVDCQALVHVHGCFADTLDVGRQGDETERVITQEDVAEVHDVPVDMLRGCDESITCETSEHSDDYFYGLGQVPGVFWSCSDHPQGMVEWDGNIAVCMADGCKNTNEK
jgi:hypothetical protein